VTKTKTKTKTKTNLEVVRCDCAHKLSTTV
jgi:hypothetical protein